MSTPIVDAIHEMVKAWYGMALPIQVRTREEQIRHFEEENKELFPNWCWDYINKNTHLILLWMQSGTCVDLVVRHNGELKFVQDLKFKDTYPSDTAWHLAIKELLDASEEVYVVFHRD